jgi:hypothetical protein
MLPFGVNIPATVPQRSEILEGLTNYPVLVIRLSRPEMIFTISEYFKLKIQTQMKTFIHCPVSVDRAYYNAWTNFRSESSSHQKKKRVHINICPLIVFKVQLNSVLASVL